jgi:hypothetical protein
LEVMSGIASFATCGTVTGGHTGRGDGIRSKGVTEIGRKVTESGVYSPLGIGVASGRFPLPEAYKCDQQPGYGRWGNADGHRVSPVAVGECRGQDLNLHPLARTSTSSWRVCQFRHLGISSLLI